MTWVKEDIFGCMQPVLSMCFSLLLKNENWKMLTIFFSSNIELGSIQVLLVDPLCLFKKDEHLRCQ